MKNKKSTPPVADRKVRVTCEAAATLPLDKLLPLQGDLKELPEANHAKLRASILRHGITFPFFAKDAPFLRVEFLGLSEGEFEGQPVYVLKLGRILETRNWNA